MSTPRHILLHTATPLRAEQFGPAVEGERAQRQVEGTPVGCALFPAGTREAGRRGRVLEQPTALLDPLDRAGVTVSLSGGDRLRIAGPGLAADMAGVYQVDGEPSPLGAPYALDRPVLLEVRLSRVVE